jgi:hypothetical protein
MRETIFVGMRMFRFINVLAIVFISTSVFSQEQNSVGWFLSANTIKVSDKWSVHAEFQLRSTAKWEHVGNILLRGGLNYHVNKKQIATAGFAYIPTRTTVGSNAGLLAEHRFWQQYIINQNIGNTVLQHRFRLEERFVSKGKLEHDEVVNQERKYSTRLRYFARAVIPFNKQQPFTNGAFLSLQEEIMANITDKQNVNNHFFDQNRAFIGLGYRASKKLDFEIGYMNQYVQRATSPNVMNHIAQFAVYTRL